VQIADEVDDFTPDVQRALLRVVQEALANIHRHASATEVSVRMKTTKKMLLFDVSDNGKGMNCSNRNGASSAHALGLGLPGMQARVSQLGGVMKIASGTHGTTVFGRVPLGQHRA
jgi:signal transduction histidine kinase